MRRLGLAPALLLLCLGSCSSKSNDENRCRVGSLRAGLTGSCQGSAKPCSSFSVFDKESARVCANQSPCVPDYDSMSCKGTATPCSQLSETYCKDQWGCSWVPEAGGSSGGGSSGGGNPPLPICTEAGTELDASKPPGKPDLPPPLPPKPDAKPAPKPDVGAPPKPDQAAPKPDTAPPKPDVVAPPKPDVVAPPKSDAAPPKPDTAGPPPPPPPPP